MEERAPARIWSRSGASDAGRRWFSSPDPTFGWSLAYIYLPNYWDLGDAEVGSVVHPSVVLPFLVCSRAGSVSNLLRGPLLNGRRIDPIYGIRYCSAIHSNCVRDLCGGVVSLAHWYRIAPSYWVRDHSKKI